MSHHHRKMLAKVHIAKKQLGLEDETYRDILERVTGQRTAAGLGPIELDAVLAEMRRFGWKPFVSSTNPHVRKVWALWNDMCRRGVVRTPTRAALRAFVTRMTGVADPEWLTPEQTNIVVEALKAWQRREGAKP